MMVRSFKVVVVGDPTVGKTSFVIRICHKRMPGKTKPTLGVDFVQKIATAPDGSQMRINFWDISGQESTRLMTRVYYRDADVAIVLYDLTNANSFAACHTWLNDIRAKCRLPDGSLLPVILLGNKLDLESERAVFREDVQRFVAEHNTHGWLEISTKENLHVDDVSDALTKELLAVEEQRLRNKGAFAEHLSGFPISSSPAKSRTFKCC